MGAMTALRTARDRARAEIRAEILTVADRHVASHGPVDLSLRAVARELEIVPSAVYRYFDNRDALLTALIVETYNSLGEAAEAAAARSPRNDPLLRWVTVASEVRSWAFANPHRYALIYGTPVPGYQAPPDTVGPGTRATWALVGIVADAHADGRLGEAAAEMSPETIADIDAVTVEALPGVPRAALFWGIVAWTQLFGLVSFELFGQTKGLITRGDALFLDAARNMGERIGLRNAP
jgi:AcrR family transcriptional regulator